MTPTYWGWCGCNIWPIAYGPCGTCGRCGKRPVFVASNINFAPDGVTREEAERMVRDGEVTWHED